GRPREVAWIPFSNGFRLHGWHDGYTRLRGRPIHGRRFTWHDTGVLMVRDNIEATAPVSAVSRIHLHPQCEIVMTNGHGVTIRTQAGLFVIRFVGEGRLQIEDSYYCPEFGKQIPNRALAWATHSSNTVSGYCFAPGASMEQFDLNHGATVNSNHYSW